MSVFDHITDADRPLVVTDTETTGTSAANNRIIEIGAIRLDPDGRQTAFEQLIDPGVSIPHRITRITGITSSMLVGRPSAADVLPEFLEFLGDGVLVAHNLRFDESFLNAELARANLTAMRNPALCSLKLARRLLPGLRSKSLASLAKFYRIPSHGRHRALRDVEITVEVLERLLRVADVDHGIRSLIGLLELQTRTYARVNPLSRHVDRIRNQVLPKLPDEPGVYRMVDGRGEVLYIGKAKSLSSRVRSYFTAVEAHPPRTRELIGRVRDVEWLTFDTELEALIEESRLIKVESPSFNRALTKFT
ncbi:MAG: GIY-YIG nuclease family protein, partial [Rhodothermales bacterium]|nr:GIY-YIG nuclease family protein [Rhodothermales bacterium]